MYVGRLIETPPFGKRVFLDYLSIWSCGLEELWNENGCILLVFLVILSVAEFLVHHSL